MKNTEILEQSIAEGAVPKSFARCFLEQCGRKAECLHYQYYQLCSDKPVVAEAVCPEAVSGGECRCYVPVRVVREAWGFSTLFRDVRAADAPKLRRAMKTLVGSNSQYYRYKLGQLKLTPAQQAEIRRLFADYGYDGVEFEHYSDGIAFGNG